MIENNLIPKLLTKNIIHIYNYITNKKYNVIVKMYMDIIAILKKKNYICFINIKYLNNHFTNNFEITIKVILASLTNKFERKFV